MVFVGLAGLGLVGLCLVGFGLVGLITGEMFCRVPNMILDAAGLFLIFLMLGGQVGITLFGFLFVIAAATAVTLTNPHLMGRLRNPDEAAQVRNVRFAATFFCLAFDLVLLVAYLLGAWLI